MDNNPLLNFDQPFDVNVFDQAVTSFYIDGNTQVSVRDVHMHVHVHVDVDVAMCGHGMHA